MFLQNKLFVSTTSLTRSGFFSWSTKGQESSEAGGSESRVVSQTILATQELSWTSYFRHQLWRAKKRILRTKQTHGLALYHPMTFQRAWTPRPQHVSFAGTMWVDLTMVGVLYRLDEFFVRKTTDSFEGFWVPYVLFLAVFDAWEVGPLLQAEFRNHGISLVHSFMYLLSWLFLAMMGATIPYPKSPGQSLTYSNGTSIAWNSEEQAAFSYVKLCHAALRVVFYLDIVFLSKSKHAREAAQPRLITYCAGLLPLIAAPILATYQFNPIVVASCFLISFLLQKFTWHSIFKFNLGKMRSKARAVRTNMPFVITRFRDWTQLQLGACVLGLLTEYLQTPIFNENRFHMYFVLVASYFFLALLDLLSYSSDPLVFHDHALIIGGIHAIFWFELFTLFGLSLHGVAVGLRYVFQHPPSVSNDRTSFIWLLVVSSIIAIFAILLQEANHKSSKKAHRGKKRLVLAKILAASTSIIAPAVTLYSAHSGPLYWVPLNLTVSTFAVLMIHAASGGFRKEVAKKTDFDLNGRILAALIARAWLRRARLKIAHRNQQALVNPPAQPNNEESDESNKTERHDKEQVKIFVVGESNESSRLEDLWNVSGQESASNRSMSIAPQSSVHNNISQTDLSPLEALAAVFSESRRKTVFDDAHDLEFKSASWRPSLMPGGDDGEFNPANQEETESDLGGAEILRAIASFRKRSTMIPVALSQKLLLDDSDDQNEEAENVSLVDVDKDIFFEDAGEVGDDSTIMSPETELEFHRSSQAPSVIAEEEEPDIEEGVRPRNDPSWLSAAEPSEPGEILVTSGMVLMADNPSFSSLGEALSSELSITQHVVASPLQHEDVPHQRPMSGEKGVSKAIIPDDKKEEGPLSEHSEILHHSGNARPDGEIAVDVASPTIVSTRVVRFAMDSIDGSADRTVIKASRNNRNIKNIYKYVKDSVQSTANRAPQGPFGKNLSRVALTGGKAIVTSRVLRKVLNERFYEQAHLLAAQDVFAEYSVSWSDLFIDIIYVGAVYRLGDYLAQGLQLRAMMAPHLREPLTPIIFLYACLFFAIFNLWYVKLGYSSKVGVTDVFHKITDVCQGLVVLICAANITSPAELRRGFQQAMIITSCLAIYHASMLGLWFEISVGKVSTTNEFACSRRNMRRCLVSLGALLFAFLSCGLGAPLEVTSLFWGLSWFFQVIERVMTVNLVKSDEKAPFLLRYVLHRLGDGALVLLGEGVFQIIRAVGQFGLTPFAVFFLSFTTMAAARVALFQMDCFDEHVKKHAVFNSRRAHIAIQFVRSLFGPTIVGMGVGLKLIVDKTTTPSNQNGELATVPTASLECIEVSVYELLCVCSMVSLGCFFSIYHLHRSAYFRRFRWKHLLIGWSISGCFLIFPWIRCIHPLIVTGGCVAIWSIAILFHSITDDLFSTKDDHGSASAGLPNSQAGHEITRRATQFARKSIFKAAD